MFNKTKLSYYRLGAALTAGMLVGSTGSAYAAANNFGNLAQNITAGIADLPGLFTSMSYLFGLLLAIMGILKIKETFEKGMDNASIRPGVTLLIIGGILLALPIMLEAMQTTAGTGNTIDPYALKAVSFNVIS